MIRTITEQVADGLRHLIREEGLMPGDRIGREEDLARAFGVSRPTMREAIRLVSQGGSLRSAKGPGGGTFVFRDPVDTLNHSLADDIATMLDLRAVTLEELANARRVLELPVVGLAAQRIDDATIAELWETVDQFDSGASFEEAKTANTRFHRLIARASGNPILQSSIDWAFEVLQPRQYETMPLGFVDHPHSHIVDALATRDPAAAIAAMDVHLRHVGEFVKTIAPEQHAVRPGAAARVALQVQTHVQREGLKPGDRLGREDELVELFSCSRAALREALQVLKARHLIRVNRGPGGGIFVAHTFEDGMSMTVSRSVMALLDAKLVTVEQMFEARIAIEPGLAHEAARIAGPDDVAALRAELETHAGLATSASVDLFERRRFHRMIASIAPNRIVSGIISWMFDAFEPGLDALYESESERRLALEQDRRIYAAIAAADPDAAEQAMREHLEYFARAAVDAGL